MNRKDITFAEFYTVWANLQKWEVPVFHYEIIEFLDNFKNWDNDSAVLQVFRGAGKSTILGLFIVYMLVKDPTLRFLVLSADHLTSSRISQDCISIINRHPLAKHLKSKISKYKTKETWQQHRFSVSGAKDARNPSVASHGIMSNITSARADFVIFDDVEVPKNCQSEQLRGQLRNRISETTHILVPKTGRKLFVGTPHAHQSIYPEEIEKGNSSLKLPIFFEDTIVGEFPNLTGVSRWPERFDPHTIQKRINSCKTRAEFESQYMLLPKRIEDSMLDPMKAIVYDTEINFYYANRIQTAKIGDTIISGVTTFWDVSLSKVRGDASVFAIVFTTLSGHYYLHVAKEITGDVYEQCEQVKELVEKYRIPIVNVEVNGIGGFVPQILLSKLKGMHVGVNDIFTTTNKGQRIIEAYETPLSGGFLHVHKQVMDGPWSAQMIEFHPRNSREHDDFIDAPASAIAQSPIRIGLGGPNKNSPIDLSWRGYSNISEIKVDMVDN